MRLALISDIHGNLPALLAVVEDIARQQVDLVVNLGDHLSGPLLPRETAEYLMTQSSWVQLAGNHERQLLTLGAARRGESDSYAHAQLEADHLAWLATLLPTATLAPGVLVCHGSPGSDLEYLLETVEPAGIRAATPAEINARLGAAAMSASLVACGHTHVPRMARAGQLGTTLAVNPGSVGLPAYADDHPYPHVVENDSPHARYAIARHRPDGWHVELKAIPYDHAAMASLALVNGRRDWAHALATGRVP